MFGKHYDDEVFLTIILPVYDHPEEFIKRALDSALEQKCNYLYQIIVIDDYAKEKGQTVTYKRNPGSYVKQGEEIPSN